MARGIIRTPSFNKIVGAYRSQWKRFLLRLFTFGFYGRKGMGWLKDPEKAWYNFWYHRTSISMYRILGFKPSRKSCFFAIVCASIIGIILAPVDAARAGVAAHQIKREYKSREDRESSGSAASKGSKTSSKKTSSKKSSPKKTSAESNRKSATDSTSLRQDVGASSVSLKTSAMISEKSYTAPKTSQTISESSRVETKSVSIKEARTTEKPIAAKSVTPKPVSNIKPVDSPKPVSTVVKPKATAVQEKPRKAESYSATVGVYRASSVPPIVEKMVEEPKIFDENIPKSKPRGDKDQYIRKRMIIAGSSYCKADTLAKLSVGTYFDVVAETDNPHDKDAIMLTLGGEKIAYIAKSDRSAFATCLKLKRKIYGVITDIDMESSPTKYEFETWFDQSK